MCVGTSHWPQNVVETLASKEPQMVVIEDKAQQIGIEGTPADSRAMREQVAALRVKADNLRRRADREASEFTKVMEERWEFDIELSEHIEWLRHRQEDLDQREVLGLAAESIEKELDQYYDNRHGLFARLQAIHEQVEEQRQHYERLEEAVPLEVQEKMDAFGILRETLLVRRFSGQHTVCQQWRGTFQ